MVSLKNTLLQFRTAVHLKPTQLFFYILRRGLPPRFVTLSGSPTLRYSRFNQPPCEIESTHCGSTTFRFLNIQAKLGGCEADLDWSAASQSKLWRYNLHYFNDLRDLARPSDNKNKLIQSWISSNPQGTKISWDPYPTSLRIVNWIFYLRQLAFGDTPSSWLSSLYLQTLWLEKNDERHILANHYFENLKALLFAGCFFDGPDANRWVKRGLKEIPKQLSEQILDDGGHYERSHLYHSLMIEGLLDIYNLGSAYPTVVPVEFLEIVKSYALRALEWLAATNFPNGTIPLLNDAAFGVAIAPNALFSYAERLSLNFRPPDIRQLEVIERPSSGLYGCRNHADMIIIDCGDIGPEYQPGHTHCDFLSYELMLRSQPVIVDTGVFEYEAGPLRDYVRSTKAHNTVSVDDDEQSEIWSQFRVARRARKIAAKIESDGRAVRFSGSFRGFYNVKGRITHQRSVTISLSEDSQIFEKVYITDCVGGRGRHAVESFVHLHPEITVAIVSDSQIVLSRDNWKICSIHVSPNQDIRVESTVYCPEFGRQIPNQTIVLKAHGDLPLTLWYELRVETC